MTEREEKKSGNTFWQVLVGVLIFNIISRSLGVWLIESVANGIGFFAVALIGYSSIPERKVGFLKWALGSLLITIGFMSLIYGVPYLLCGRLGAVLTMGLVGFVLAMSLRLVPEFMFKKMVEETLLKWLLAGVVFGLFFALLAYINPSGFCPNR